MMSTTIRLRTVVLRLTVILSWWLRTQHAVLAADIVVQDTDPLILYQPIASWHSSTDSCSNCLNPGGGSSYHEAIHPAAGPDADDVPHTSTQPSQSSSSTASSPPPEPTTATSPNVETVDKTPAGVGGKKPATATSPAEGDEGGDPGHKSPESSPGKSGSGSSSPSSGGKSRRDFLRRDLRVREDPDDPGFTDPDVTLSFNFTGYAISIYSTQPLGVATSATNNTPTNMNLTFLLDNQSMGDFTNVGSPLSTGFLQNKAIFSRSNLEDGSHQLVIHVGQNSSFIFDYLVYSTNAAANSTSSSSSITTPSTSLAGSLPSQSVDPKTMKHDVATFAGAVGGSVGVLGFFALALALSIIRRRRMAARRDRLDSESLHTEGTDDSPRMAGPAPFVPRFFPDTVIPSDPPTYTAATNHNGSTLLARLGPPVYPVSSRAYADVPPSSPPPLDEEVVLIPPPPPFPVAVASPPVNVVALPSIAEGATPISDAIAPSHNLGSVGISSSNSDIAPETVPLLQSVVLATSDLPPLLPLRPMPSPRPPSPAPSISYDIHGNPMEDPAQEDVTYGRGR